MMTSQIFAGTDYYVDATNGNDLNDGLTPGSAWQTVSKVNGSSFSPGDNIYFNRGDTWREKLTVPSSGSYGSPITFTSYGSGNDPKLLRSVAKNSTGDWTNESGNLWYATSASEVFNVIYDSESSEAIMETAKGNLNTQGEAWWDSGNSRIYVYSTSNPATYYNGVIECALNDVGIHLNQKSYITIDGLDIRYTGHDGIFGEISNLSNITIQNCNISYTGSNLSGGPAAFIGKGITLKDANGSLIDNNTFSYNFNAITLLASGAWSLTISNNTITNQHGNDGGEMMG